MKNTLFLLVILCLFSCGKEDTSSEKIACTEITLGENIELAHNTQVCIDQVEYTFNAKDERCCCGCVCVWAGEFLLTFLNADEEVVYTFHESGTSINEIPPFGESMEIISITNQVPDCGDNSQIDDARFTIVIN